MQPIGVGGKSSPSSLRGHSQPLQKPPASLSGFLLALLGCSHPKDSAQAPTCDCTELLGTRQQTRKTRFSMSTRTWTFPSQQPSQSQEPVGDFGLHQSPSPGAPRRKGSPTAQISLAPPQTRPGSSKALEWAKALWRQHYHHCSQHPAVRLQDSQGDGQVWQQRGDGDAPQRAGTTGPAASSREALAASQKPLTVTMYTTSAKVKQAGSTKVVSHPAPG